MTDTREKLVDALVEELRSRSYGQGSSVRTMPKELFERVCAALLSPSPAAGRVGEISEATKSRLRELVAEYPEPWVIEKEPHNYNDGTTEFTHVRYYKSPAREHARGETICVEIGSHVTPDLAELLILLRESASAMLSASPSPPQAEGDGWRAPTPAEIELMIAEFPKLPWPLDDDIAQRFVSALAEHLSRELANFRPLPSPPIPPQETSHDKNRYCR